MGVARDILDIGDLRRYSAHLIRDLHVCGNGYLLLPPPAGPRLLLAEDIWHDGQRWMRGSKRALRRPSTKRPFYTSRDCTRRPGVLACHCSSPL